jgi:hypothetical protein
MDVISWHMTPKDDPEKVLKVKLVVSDTMKRVPKFCNGTFLGKLNDGSGRIILTLVSNETTTTKESQSEIGDESVIIERILLDKDHAKSIAEKLIDLTQE